MKSPVVSILKINNTLASKMMVLAFFLALAISSVPANDCQIYRVLADAPTRITSISPDGQITWTSAVPNINFTIEASPKGTGAWGAVVSGVQPGLSHKVDVFNPNWADNVISVCTYYHTNIVGGMRIQLLQLNPWGLRAQAFTGYDGYCYFYGMPPNDYLVGYEDTAVYSGGYWGSGVIDGVEQTNRFRVYLTKWPVLMLPKGQITSAPEFYWISVPEATWYRFSLYKDGWTLLDEADGLFTTNYQTSATFENDGSYRWELCGYDKYGAPVMKGEGDLTSWFSGPGGGTDNGGCDKRVFGTLMYSQFPIAGMGLSLRNSGGVTVYQTTTDAQGWYLFEGVAAGTYDMLMDSSDYVSSYFTRVVMPDDAGFMGLSKLTKLVTNLKPGGHQVVGTSQPIFSWDGNPECVAYTVILQEAASGQEIFTRTGLTQTFLQTPVSLANGEYFWIVRGYDAFENLVRSGGAMFTVQVQ